MLSLRNQKTNQKNREEKKDKKCPYCGQIISSFDDKCPSCGSSLTTEDDLSAVLAFSRKLEQFNNGDSDYSAKEKQIKYIQNFIVPNNQESMQRIMNLIINKIEQIIDEKSKRELMNALISKGKEINNMAIILYPNNHSFENQLKEIEQKIEECQKRRKRKAWLIAAIIIGAMFLIYILDKIFGPFDTESITSSLAKISIM